MQASIEFQSIALGGLATLFSEENRKNVLLIDETGNAFTFFKYKAKLIDVESLFTAVSISQKTKESAVEEIRKGLTYGLKSGQCTIFHIGAFNVEINDFLKNEKFWEPQNLFRPPSKIDQNWYQSKLMKETDEDPFGGKGTLLPSDSYRIFVSCSR